MRFDIDTGPKYGERYVSKRFAFFPLYCHNLNKYVWLETVNELREFRSEGRSGGSMLRGGIHYYRVDTWGLVFRTSQDMDPLEWEKIKEERDRIQRRKEGSMNWDEFQEYVKTKKRPTE